MLVLHEPIAHVGKDHLFTLVTILFDLIKVGFQMQSFVIISIVDGLNMFCKGAFLCCLIVALTTVIFDSFMNISAKARSL